MEATASIIIPPRLATAQDLERVRPVIEQLYKKMTLPDLIDTMMREHGLKPTVNMLKKRIRLWGLDNKHNKEEEMRAIVRKRHQRSRIGKDSNFRARGRVIQYKDVVRYWERKRLTIEDVFAQCTSRGSTPNGLEVLTPVPSPVSTPAVLAIPERMLTGISNYIKASFESRTWISEAEDIPCISSKDPSKEVWLTTALWRSVSEAFDLLEQGESQEAGQLLIHSTASVKDTVIAEEPHILPSMIGISHESFARGRHMMGMAIVRQFIAFGELLLCQGHPIPQLLALIATVADSQLEDVIGRCSLVILHRFAEFLGLTHTSTLVLTMLFVKIIRPTDFSIQVMRSSIHRFETSLQAHSCRCLAVRCMLADTYVEQNLLDEAEEEVEKIFECSRGTTECNWELFTRGLHTLARVYDLRHDHGFAENISAVAIKLRNLWERIQKLEDGQMDITSATRQD